MTGIGILGWLLVVLLGWPGPTAFVESEVATAPPTDLEMASRGPVADRFFTTTPHVCGVVGEDVAPRDSRRHWDCLRLRAEAGRAGQLMVALDHSTVVYYRVTADGALEIYTDRLDAGDMTLVACPMPRHLRAGCP